MKVSNGRYFHLFVDAKCRLNNNELGKKMKIEHNQLNDSALSIFGMEVVSLLLSGIYAELAQRFGYAMSYGRIPAEAIKEDFTNCCQLNGSQPISYTEVVPTIAVKYFKPNESTAVGSSGMYPPSGQC